MTLHLKTIKFSNQTKYTNEEKIELLKQICDEDFNGNNGSGYYYLNEEVSDLEYLVINGEHLTMTELIDSIVANNYEGNNYYKQYNISLVTIGDGSVFSIATLS